MGDFRQYHTIFFDVGGTILRAMPSVGGIYAELAARYGIRVEADEVERGARRFFAEEKEKERRAGRTPHTMDLPSAKAFWREVVRKSFGPAAESPRFDEFYDAVFAEFAKPERYEPFPEVRSLLDDLRSAGYRLGVISNWDARLRPILEGLGLIGRFQTVVISCEVRREKPDPEIYHLARSIAGAPQNVPLLQIGDSYADDVEGAEGAGFNARLIVRQKGNNLRRLVEDLLMKPGESKSKSKSKSG